MVGAAGGDRTHDPWLRRPILYPLSYSRYGCDCRLIGGAGAGQASACINCGLTSIVSGFCDCAQNDASAGVAVTLRAVAGSRPPNGVVQRFPSRTGRLLLKMGGTAANLMKSRHFYFTSSRFWHDRGKIVIAQQTHGKALLAKFCDDFAENHFHALNAFIEILHNCIFYTCILNKIKRLHFQSLFNNKNYILSRTTNHRPSIVAESLCLALAICKAEFSRISILN